MADKFIILNEGTSDRLKWKPVPLTTRKTPLEQIPVPILRLVLPFVTFYKGHDCWMYDRHAMKDARGEPIYKERLRYGYRNVLLKREIAECFVDIPPKYDWRVYHLCGNRSCLNPAHLAISGDHQLRVDVEALCRKHLKPGTFYVGV